jgi:hypothetical protein
MIGALYALGMYLSWVMTPSSTLLVVLGIMLSATASLSNFSARPWTGAYGMTWPRSTIAIVCSRKPAGPERSG